MGARNDYICGEYAFLLTNIGLFKIYDMRKDFFAGSLVLASAHAKNHANNACVLVLNILKITINSCTIYF